MKAFTTFIDKIKQRPRVAFACQIAGFYLLLMVLYLYFMTANLSSAPKFVYTAF